VHQLNLDPRWRVAAGLGAAVVQAKRDHHVAVAEQQFEDARAATRARARAQLAHEVGLALLRKHIAGRGPDSTLQLLAPLQSRISWDIATIVDANAPIGEVLVAARPHAREHTGEPAFVRTTIERAVAASATAPTLLSPAFRSLTRPRGPLMRRVGARGQTLLSLANDDEITAAPDKRTPTTAMTYAHLREHMEPAAQPRWLMEFGREGTLQLLVVLTLLFTLIAAYAYVSIVAFAILLVADVVMAAYVLAALRRVAHESAIADSLSLHGFTPEWAERIDLDGATHARALARPGTPRSHPPAAARWRQALVDFHAMLDPSAPASQPRPLAPAIDLDSLAAAMLDAITPWRAAWDPGPSELVFEQPMVEALVELSPQWLLPNHEYIPNNTIARVEVNHEFIEAYMIGLNHEIVRELSWREFPIDRRATCFRHFWPGHVALAPLATWPSASVLGSHIARADLVLVVRGELIAQYPQLVVRAQRAAWAGVGQRGRTLAEHGLDLTREVVLSARLAPDLAVFGFALSAEQARGDDDPAGWFLVFGQAEPSDAPQVIVHAAELLSS
jgi:hypothetical protein